MSIVVDVTALTDEQRGAIDTKLQIRVEDKFSKKSKFIYPYDIRDASDGYPERVVLPFAFGRKLLRILTEKQIPSAREAAFKGELREEQKEIQKEALDALHEKGSVIVSCAPGFGKTITSISIACSLCAKTLVVVNKIVLMTQWSESVKRFFPSAKIQMLTPKTKKVSADADFFICNALNVEKFESTVKNVDLLILDEVHLLLAERLSKLTMHVQPKYLLGLSATPYRLDGLNSLFDIFFGKKRIHRDLFHPHTFYVVRSEFKPRIERTITGKLNWSAVLDSQSKDEKRNALITDIVCSETFKERSFLVLVKRVEHGKVLANMISTRIGAENVTSLLGTNQTFDKNARVLVGSSMKVGVGFDHPRMDTLVLATDFEAFFVQILARVFRRKDSVPIVFDIVDNQSTLKKHHASRVQVSKKHGGIVMPF